MIMRNNTIKLAIFGIAALLAAVPIADENPSVMLQASAEETVLDTLHFQVYDDHAEVIRSPEATGDLTIPDTVEGVPVTVIGSAFADCTGLTSVTIPDTVTIIRGSAFRRCTSLQTIEIPETITEVGSYAFEETPWFTSQQQADPLVTVGQVLIDGSTASGSVTIPANVRTISDSAFRGNANLTSINLGNVEKIGAQAFMETGLTSVILPDTVTELGNQVFSGCTSLQTVHLPSNLTAIPQGMFIGCTSLASPKLPANLTSIGGYAFQDCTTIDAVEIPETVTALGAGAFAGCTGLTSLRIPAGFTEIPEHLCENCEQLQTVNVPDSVTAIGKYAFSNCELLEDFQFPPKLETIGVSAFYKTALTEVILPDTVRTIEGDAENYPAFGCPKLRRVVLPNGMESIAPAVFSGCTSLEEIVFPSGLKDIQWAAFSGCSSLKSIDLPDSVELIVAGAFQNCTGLAEVTLPKGLKEIGDGTFMGCDSLTTAVFPSGCKVAGGFRDCTALTTVVLSEGVETVSDSGFYGTSLREITFPSTLKTIGSYAFSGCTGLTSVELPDGTESIYYGAFQDCTSLAEVILPDSLYDVQGKSFSGTPWLEQIDAGSGDLVAGGVLIRADITSPLYTVPDGVRVIAGGAFGESDALTITDLDIPEGVVGIGNALCYHCKTLQSVTLPSTLKVIGSQAFEGCTALTAVTLPDGAKTVGHSAFEGCTSLSEVVIPEGLVLDQGDVLWNTQWLKDRQAENPFVIVNDCLIDGSACTGDVVIPDGVKIIADLAFGAAEITSVTMPDSVTWLGNQAFGSEQLETVTFSKNLTYIGYQSFWTCTGLKKFIFPADIGECTEGGSIVVSRELERMHPGLMDSPQLTIYGAPGTIAEELAQSYGFPFVATEEAPAKTTYGYGWQYDTNEDGILDASDATDVLLYAAMMGANGTLSYAAPAYMFRLQAFGEVDAHTPDASDATDILIYAAYVGANGETPWDTVFTDLKG